MGAGWNRAKRPGAARIDAPRQTAVLIGIARYRMGQDGVSVVDTGLHPAGPGDPLFLQVKEATASVLEDHLPGHATAASMGSPSGSPGPSCGACLIAPPRGRP